MNANLFEQILATAHEAARLAVRQEEVTNGPEGNRMDCGFAWVTTSGNEPLARYCRKMTKDAGGEHKLTGVQRRTYGSKGYPAGWQWWKPGNYAGQSIRFHEAGARAFRDALGRHNIRADVGSRLD